MAIATRLPDEASEAGLVHFLVCRCQGAVNLKVQS